MAASFLFYDLETFGANTRYDRIAQFAAIRTDIELNQIDDPIDFMVQPAADVLPSPEATLITGISPQHALQHGIREVEAFSRMHEAMMAAETCTLGYNSIRFDDEFVRHGLFRNFYDPYEREWRGGNSRWDLIDVLRLAHALRPDGITWPSREDGAPSFKLEHLAAANNVRHGDAHEALSDVRALIGLARLLKSAQPKLWDYALRLRDKRFAARMLDVVAMQPVLHISQRFPAARMCAAAVLPLARHPLIDNRIVVCDLHDDPAIWLDLNETDIAQRLYVTEAALPTGMTRVPFKEVHLNRSPILVEWSHLRPADFARLGIDPDLALERSNTIRAAGPALTEKIRRVYSHREAYLSPDIDGSLYDGFLNDADRKRCNDVRATTPHALGQRDFGFQDPRLPELLFRYRARNWPETLTAQEVERWNADRRHRLIDGNGKPEHGLAAYRHTIESLRTEHQHNHDAVRLLEQLQTWANTVETDIA